MRLIQNREAFSDITRSINNQEHVQSCKKNSSNSKHYIILNTNDLINRQNKIFNHSTAVVTHSTNLQYENILSNIDSTEYEKEEKFMLDVTNVTEYTEDIFKYLYKLDKEIVAQFLNKKYTINEVINKETLFNWIIKIHMIFGFLEETLYLTLYIIEKYQFLAQQGSPHSEELQLLAITSLFIAAKYEEIVIPRTVYYSLQTDGNYSINDIINFERIILRTINYDLSFANPLNFLRRLTLVDNFDLPRTTIAKYLLEITSIDSKTFIHFPKAQCAAASLFLSRRMFGKHEWDSKFVAYSGGYKKKDIVFICKLIIKFLLSPIVHSNLQHKYESTRYLKASIVCKEWVLAILKQQRKRRSKKNKKYSKLNEDINY